MWTALVEVLWFLEQELLLWMLLTLHRQTIVKVISDLHRLEERDPSIFAFLAVHVCFHVSEHEQAVTCSGQQDIEPFTGCEEAYVAVAIAPSQRDDDDIGLFALVIIFGVSVVLCAFMMIEVTYLSLIAEVATCSISLQPVSSTQPERDHENPDH